MTANALATENQRYFILILFTMNFCVREFLTQSYRYANRILIRTCIIKYIFYETICHAKKYVPLKEGDNWKLWRRFT